MLSTNCQSIFTSIYLTQLLPMAQTFQHLRSLACTANSIQIMNNFQLCCLFFRPLLFCFSFHFSAIRIPNTTTSAHYLKWIRKLATMHCRTSNLNRRVTFACRAVAFRTWITMVAVAVSEAAWCLVKTVIVDAWCQVHGAVYPNISAH